jgi:serine/threonine protein kinase
MMNKLKPIIAEIPVRDKHPFVGVTCAPSGSIVPVTDYTVLLTGRKIRFQSCPPYLLIGVAPTTSGWLLHLSVVRQQMEHLLDAILPELIKQKVAFILPENTDQHNRLLDGRQGYDRIGKVISIYSQSSEQANNLALLLTGLTTGFRGPEIPSAVPLAGCVYTSYGPLHPDTYPQMEGRAFTSANLEQVFPTGNSGQPELTPPDEAGWPFYPMAYPKRPKPSKLIRGGYLQIETLKNDPKGKVIKCLKINQLVNMQWCILKEGKQYQCFDDAGRDIKSRLLWQYHVQQDLAKLLPVPKPTDYFQQKGDSFMVMEYIEGVSLSEQIAAIYSGNSWSGLDKINQLRLTDYALQAITITESLHQKGYVHRDLNPENFLVSAQGHLFLIDFELCYSLTEGQPNPVFALGTPGYFSPEQNAQMVPTVSEDIFGIGGLLIKIFTGLSPLKFEKADLNLLHSELDFFLPVPFLSGLITACLHPDPQERPKLSAVKRIVEDHRARIQAGNPLVKSRLLNSGYMHSLYTTIQQAIRALATDTFKSPDQYWHNDSGLADGVAGVLYVLAIARKNGFVTKDCDPLAAINFSCLQKNYLRGNREPCPGLFTGCSGIALTLIRLYQAGFISEEYIKADQLHECLLAVPFNKLHLADGIAGHGLAMLHCLPFIDPQIACRLLNDITQNLLIAQQTDGSWIIQPDNQDTKGIKLPGLFYGVAGITYFLIAYGFLFNHLPAKQAAVRALDWLTGQRHQKNDQSIWTLNPHINTIDPWLADGFSGIALVFIKAYECFRDIRYKEVASAALLSHPEMISGNYLGLGFGLAGLGEIYLEAARIFNEEVWQHRADRIAGVLLHCGLRKADGSRYWLADEQPEPGAGLMGGHAGILHFLMRYSSPDKIAFPILSLNFWI